jgi:hypothetical protein
MLIRNGTMTGRAISYWASKPSMLIWNGTMTGPPKSQQPALPKLRANESLSGRHLVMDASSLAQSHQGTLINASSTNQILTPISLTSL